MSFHSNRYSLNRKRQKGAITMFSAVLILILLTELIIYAVQVGVFEQRKSGNEMRHKVAFHTADSGIQHAKEYLLANSIFVSSAETNLVPIVDSKGDITGYKPGWLSAGAGRWTPCAGNYSTDDKSHPCWAESVPAFRDGSYFYEFNGSNVLLTNTVVGDTGNETVTLHALLCMMEVDRDLDPVVQGCTTDTGLHDSRYFLVTLLSRGEAACDGNAANCEAEALISEKIGSFGPGGGEGGPGAPLVTRSTLPESGDTDIVTNPNGGGVGVPVSVWIDSSADIEGFGGSWTTCEAHEWYETDIMPDDFKCPAGSGNCTCDGKKQLSHSDPGAGNQHLDIDMVPDDDFPDDLFHYMFLRPGTEEGLDFVKGIADDIVPDCNGLDPGTYGLIVVEGNCDLGGNLQIGTHTAPVFLVLAGASNNVGGTVDVFGTLFVSDAVYPAAEISGSGTVTIYGALIVDGDIGKFSGNLKLVYVEDIINRSIESGAFGTVAGGWSDFHAEWR